jgi:hypothetical protein
MNAKSNNRLPNQCRLDQTCSVYLVFPKADGVSVRDMQKEVVVWELLAPPNLKLGLGLGLRVHTIEQGLGLMMPSQGEKK